MFIGQYQNLGSKSWRSISMEPKKNINKEKGVKVWYKKNTFSFTDKQLPQNKLMNKI